jgi:uncharacterized protein YqeY
MVTRIEYNPPMPTPQERIQADVKEAMKARDKERLSTLRMLLADLKNEKIRRGEEVDEDAFLATVRRCIKQRHDAEQQFRNGDREELADKEKREAEMLTVYLPQQIGADELRAAIEELVAAEGLSGPRGIGPVMKAMLKRFGAAVDGASINRIAREVLAD